MITTNHFGKSLAIIFGGVAALAATSVLLGAKPQKAADISKNQQQVVEEVNNSAKEAGAKKATVKAVRL